MNLPADALDRFVVEAIQRVLLGDHAKTKEAIDAFVASVLKPTRPARKPSGLKRELEQLNRKIKATVAMLAEPEFDDLAELRATLGDLKRRRDQLQAELTEPTAGERPEMSERELRRWAMERFADLDRLLVAGREIEPADRELVEAYVDRIEVFPETKTGVVYLRGDAWDALLRGSTRVPTGDFMGAFELAFYGWRLGSGHQFLGPNNATDLWHVKKVNPQSMVHLTEKPVELAERAIQYSSRAGEHVLDLFGGSGSTLIACERTDRRAFLMELDPPYCDVVVQRWEEFTGGKAERVALPVAA